MVCPLVMLMDGMTVVLVKVEMNAELLEPMQLAGATEVTPVGNTGAPLPL
jgi:hypothetical protein